MRNKTKSDGSAETSRKVARGLLNGKLAELCSFKVSLPVSRLYFHGASEKLSATQDVVVQAMIMIDHKYGKHRVACVS